MQTLRWERVPLIIVITQIWKLPFLPSGKFSVYTVKTYFFKWFFEQHLKNVIFQYYLKFQFSFFLANFFSQCTFDSWVEHHLRGGNVFAVVKRCTNLKKDPRLSLAHTHTLIQCEHRLPFLYPPLWVLSGGGSKLEKGWKCFTYSRLRYTPTKSVECSLEENAKPWSSFHLFLKSPPRAWMLLRWDRHLAW